jgi:hypothetical protein
MISESILFWNIRGLNSLSHRNTLCDLVATERSSIICIAAWNL